MTPPAVPLTLLCRSNVAEINKITAAADGGLALIGGWYVYLTLPYVYVAPILPGGSCPSKPILSYGGPGECKQIDKLSGELREQIAAQVEIQDAIKGQIATWTNNGPMSLQIMVAMQAKLHSLLAKTAELEEKLARLYDNDEKTCNSDKTIKDTMGDQGWPCL